MNAIYIGKSIVVMYVAGRLWMATGFYLCVHSLVIEIDENSED